MRLRSGATNRLTTERARNSCDFNARFDSCRSRCPSDLSKSAQVQLPKNVEISGDYKFRTKTAKYRALEKNARRERISRPGAAAARGIRERARAAGGLDRHLRQRPAVLLCRAPVPDPRARRRVRMGDDRGYVLVVRLARGRQARGIRARTGRCLCGVAGGGDRAISALPRLRGNQAATPRMVVELSLMTSKPGAPLSASWPEGISLLRGGVAPQVAVDGDRHLMAEPKPSFISRLLRTAVWPGDTS